MGEEWARRWLEGCGNRDVDVRSIGYWQYRDVDFRVFPGTPRSALSEWTIEVKTIGVACRTGKLTLEYSRSIERHPDPQPGLFFRSQADYWMYIVLDENRCAGTCYLFRLNEARWWMTKNAPLLTSRYVESVDPLNGLEPQTLLTEVPIDTFVRGVGAKRCRLPDL